MPLSSFALPLLRCLDPETAHDLTLKALRLGLGPVDRVPDDPRLSMKVCGLDFSNPVGLSAGFDKNAEVAGPMLRAGFGFVEAGSITPRPQPGNPKPRIFRLPDDAAVINRLGFNNRGMDYASHRLETWRKHDLAGPIGVNLGKNKDTKVAADDYRLGAEKLARFADYLVVNVSSPNTPGLRALQDRAELDAILTGVAEGASAAGVKLPPVFVKIAPDIEDSDIADLSAMALEGRMDGLIVSNTTITRPDTLKSTDLVVETGGLSGRPLFDRSTTLLAAIYRATEGKVPLIGVGGISSGADAYAKIRAGASLVQLYTALIYQGPGLVTQIKRDLVQLLQQDGHTRIGQAVGTG
ncbi:MAG: quinone-dependent dihydroorotate dehydrogenase [Alphaproteobacteria bacterium]